MSEEKPVDIGNANVRRLRAMLYRLSTSEGAAYGEIEREIIAYVGTLATPASPASATELNAMRWLFTMKHQDMQVHPQAFLDMFRKVREDGRATPTRAEFEAATDAAMIETGFVPASAQPVSHDLQKRNADLVLALRNLRAMCDPNMSHQEALMVRTIDTAIEGSALDPVSQPVVAVPEGLEFIRAVDSMLERYFKSVENGVTSYERIRDEIIAYIRATPLAAPVEQDKQDTLMPERIEAIQALGRDDPAVHAFLTLQRRDSLAWGDVLAQMVLHLAQDKAALTAQLMRQAVGSVASNADGVIRVNWMRPERVEAGTLLYCATEAVQPDAAMGSLFYSLRALTDWAEAAAVKIEGEFGFGRSLEEIIAAGDLAEEITNARTLLDGPAATPALIDPYEAVYCDLRGCEPHGLSVCDDFKQWKHDLFAIPALPNAKDVFLTFKGKLIAGYGMHIVSNDDGTLTVRPRATPALLGLTDEDFRTLETCARRLEGDSREMLADDLRAIIAALKEAP